MEEQNERTPAAPPKTHCKNCEKKLSKPGIFCPRCGQKDFDGRIRMRDLMGRFFASFTHLNNKFLVMAWELFIPARVTINYFQGKIKRYPHPVQFFFIVMFFFLLMFSKQFNNAGFNMTGDNLRIGGAATFEVQKGTRRIAQSGLFEAIQHCISAREYRSAYDSLPAEWQTPLVRHSLDSVVRLVDGPWEAASRFILETGDSTLRGKPGVLDTIPLNFVRTSVRIASADLVNLSPDSIIAKYGFQRWDEKTTVRQGIKSLKDPKSLIHSYVGSLGWTILVLIAVMAFVLRLLYWRQKRYYVEHFIFLTHQQAGAFLLLTIAMVLNEYVFTIGPAWLLVIGWIGVALLIALKRFYRQSWGWTIVKWLLYCAAYLFLLTVFFIATLLVVFVVF